MTWMARRVLKAPLLASGLLRWTFDASDVQDGVAFLIYHRVNGGLPIELDIPPALFERQIAFLAAGGSVCSFDEALARIGTGGVGAQNGIVLTFDDGYEDFYTRVFPMLQEYDLPAILYVTTGFVEEGTPYPMLSNPESDVAPVTWDMLGEMAASGLVTLGAHTHTHPVLSGLSAEQVEEELEKPLELFDQRIGVRPQHFAYPRAVADCETRTLVERYYASAVVGGGHRAMNDGFDRYSIPRIPVRRSDGWAFFRAKLNGWLDGEEPTYEWLHRLAERIPL